MRSCTFFGSCQDIIVSHFLFVKLTRILLRLLPLFEEILFLLVSFLFHPGALGGFRVSFIKKNAYGDFLTDPFCASNSMGIDGVARIDETVDVIHGLQKNLKIMTIGLKKRFFTLNNYIHDQNLFFFKINIFFYSLFFFLAKKCILVFNLN